MYAKHLMAALGSGSKDPPLSTSDIGRYQAGAIQVWDVDRSAGMVYGTREFSDAQANTYAGRAVVAADGTVLLVPSAGTTVLLKATDASGPKATLGTFARPTGTIWQLYGRSACVQAQVSGGYALTHVDLATGVRYPMGTVPDLEAWNSGDDLFVGSGRTTFALKGTSGAFWTVLAAGAGRASRAVIARQVYDDAPQSVFLRMKAEAAPAPVPFSPFRRPLSTDTRVRGYVLGTGSGFLGDRHPRQGRSVATRSIRVYEVEIGASLGTTTAGGQPCSRHRMTVSYSELDGFMRVSAKDGVTYVATRRMDDTTGWDLLQYLAADGSPTGEFIIEAAGKWDYIQHASPVTGNTPLLATRRNLIRVRSETSFDVLTSEGEFVRTCTVPTSIFSNPLVCLSNADAIFTGGYSYGTTYGSFDLGATWQQFTVWGARGSARPPLVPPNSPGLEQLATMLPLFPT